jgi:hypothetical protein
MPGWTARDDRQYEHIKEQLEDRGKPSGDARSIAARTVNKTRRQQGRTPNRTTQGTGNPTTRLEARTRDELYNIARKNDIAGRSALNKAELIEAIRSRR